MQTSGSPVLHAVRELVPTVQARSAETEAGRRLPAELLAQLKAAGVFRMFVPRSHGGLETDLLTGMEVLETLARADGATGWTCMIGSESPHLLALLPRHRFDALYAEGPDVLVGGGFNPRGEAARVDGGYRVTGRWAFASGSEHCDWLIGNCVVTEEGRPLPGPAEGVPATRTMLFRARDVRILDTWSVLGLRGTGSHDITVEHHLVPADDSFDLFMGAPGVPGPGLVAPVLHCALHMGAVAVGIAQGALDDMVALVHEGKRRLYAKSSLSDSQLFQTQLGRAETRLRAARALMREESRRLWDACVHAPEAAVTRLPYVTSALAWTAETAAAVVDTCYTAAGASSVRDGASLQRRFRDIHTFTQHASTAEAFLGQAGGALLGKPLGLAV